MNVQQTCSRLLYPCRHLSMDVTDSGRTWSGRLRTGHDSRQSCWQRVKVVIGTTHTCDRLLFEVQSRYRYVYHVLKPILPTTATSSTRQGSCRHARASTTLRPHPVQSWQHDLADCFEHVQNNRRCLPFCQDLPDPLKFYNVPHSSLTRCTRS